MLHMVCKCMHRYNMYNDKTNLGEMEVKGGSGREIDGEVVDYYLHLAEEGDINAAVSLAWIYLQVE